MYSCTGRGDDELFTLCRCYVKPRLFPSPYSLVCPCVSKCLNVYSRWLVLFEVATPTFSLLLISRMFLTFQTANLPFPFPSFFLTLPTLHALFFPFLSPNLSYFSHCLQASPSPSLLPFFPPSSLPSFQATNDLLIPKERYTVLSTRLRPRINV